MSIAGDRAIALKVTLESQGNKVLMSDPIDGQHCLGLNMDQEGETYAVLVSLWGNAIRVLVDIASFDETDLLAESLDSTDVRALGVMWITMMAEINSAMDGICYSCVDVDGLSISMQGIVKGYYLSEEGFTDYALTIIERALNQSSNCSNYFEIKMEGLAEN